MCPSAWVATKPLWWILGQHIVLMIAYILRSTCFCEIWALWVSWITYDQLYYALCLVCWELSSSLVPAMYNRISCAQVHEFPQNHCSENREGTLFLWLHIYIILGYNIKQLIAKYLCCYVFVWIWIHFHLTCKAWRLQYIYIVIYNIYNT